MQEIIQSSYNYNDLYNNIRNHKLENINFNLEKDKKVKLCFNIDDDKTNIEGYIEDIDDSTIFIKPINLGDENDSNETLEIDKKDKNVKVLNIENGKRNCLVEDENMFKIFIFDDEEIVNRNILKKYLRNIIPNTNEIIKKYIKEFGKIDDKTVSGIENNLAYYDLKLDHFTFDNLKELISLLYQHNQKLADDADEEENKFMKFLKNMPKTLRKNIPFINAKS